MKKVNVGKHQMAYHRSGSGETIVLVHGITTYSFIWRKIIPRLAERYDVIAIDLLGCGESDKPLNISYSIAAHAHYLFQFTEALELKKFHLIGHDLGGGISQIFATKHQNMLHDITLINSVAFDFWPVQPVLALRTPIVRNLMMSALDFGALKMLIKKGMYHQENVTDELLALFQEPLKSKEGRKAFMHFARCLDTSNLTDITEQLKALSIPTLIMRGEADPFLLPAISTELNNTIPNSQLLTIATASHFLMEDEPAWASQQILSFITDSHD